MDRDITDFGSDQSRRSILKQGALSVGALTLGASGTAVAQNDDDDLFDDDDDGVFDDDDETEVDEYQKALMYVGHAHPDSNFVVTSPVLDWTPSVEEIEDNVWSDYNTRVIRYLNTDEQAMFWVADDASLPDYDPQAGYDVDAAGDTGPNQTPEPEVFQMHAEWSPFGDAAYVTVNFTAVGEEDEDDLLEDDDWWIDDDDDNGGVAGNATGNGGVAGNATGNGGVAGNATGNGGLTGNDST